MTRNSLLSITLTAAAVAVLAISFTRIEAQQPAPKGAPKGGKAAPAAPPEVAPPVAIDADDISGVVRGPTGPEDGVWVIAETRELTTNYVNIVVTDDQGRYLLPDLQTAYDVVRGMDWSIRSPRQIRLRQT
jgi:hypothetical protein